MTRKDEPQERVGPNADDVSTTSTRYGGKNDASDGRALDASPDQVGGTGNTNTGVTGLTSV